MLQNHPLLKPKSLVLFHYPLKKRSTTTCAALQCKCCEFKNIMLRHVVCTRSCMNFHWTLIINVHNVSVRCPNHPPLHECIYKNKYTGVYRPKHVCSVICVDASVGTCAFACSAAPCFKTVLSFLCVCLRKFTELHEWACTTCGWCRRRAPVATSRPTKLMKRFSLALGYRSERGWLVALPHFSLSNRNLLDHKSKMQVC